MLQESKALYTVIGDPIAHSVSPVIHNTLFARHELNAEMKAVRVAAKEVDAFFARAKEEGIRGSCVTMPLKQAVIPFCNEVTKEAQAAQSVNCLTWREDGIHGDTTDAEGLERALAQDGVAYNGSRILFLGGGAVSLPILISMAGKAKHIIMANRTKEKAEANRRYLAEHFDCAVDVIAMEPDALRDAAQKSNLILNTTSLGMQGMAHDFEDLSFLQTADKGTYVADVIYHPAETSFLKAAASAGLRHQNGLQMLIFQAFTAFEQFTGIRPDDADLEAVKEALQ